MLQDCEFLFKLLLPSFAHQLGHETNTQDANTGINAA